MILKSARQFFKPLFESDHDELIVRFLYVIIISVMSGIVIEVGLYILGGAGFFSRPLLALVVLLILQIVFLFMLRRGHVILTSRLLVITGWLGVTYQAWSSDGIRDVIIFVYILVILMAALTTGWRISLALSLLSIAAIWGMALAELYGMKPARFDTSLHLARDLTVIFLLLIVIVFLMVNTLRQTLVRMQGDFTARVNAQQALLQSEARFRKVFQNSPVAIVITAVEDGRIIDANQAYWELSGHDPKTSIGKTTLELRRDLRPATRQQFVTDLLDKKTIQNPSYDFVDEQGNRLKTVAFYELFDINGQPGILSMFYDITEQHNARDALHQSENRLRAMLESVPDMIFELKRDGMIVQFMPSVDEAIKLSSGDFIGKHIGEVLPDAAAQARFAIERAIDSGQVNAFEYQMSLNGEQKIFEARVTPVGDDMVLAIVRDVTLQRWAVSERESLIEELEEKNAELERFTYTVSHDLKSPLITIKSFLGFVREDAVNANLARLEKDIQRVNDATDKMQHLLADLLDLSRVGRMKNTSTTVQVAQLISEVTELLQGRLQELNVRISVAENLPLVYGDRQRIGEVFQNLIDNSAKFMGSQSEPHIEIGVRGELDGKPIFFVRDNGMGVAPQFKEKIFGLFEKLDARSEGTGIGLALVKRIIEHHGCAIWLESELGHGATFLFTLPTPPEPE